MAVDLPVNSELEKYLESHPEFIQKWLLEKASPEMVKEVLNGCSSTQANEAIGVDESKGDDDDGDTTFGSNHNNNNKIHYNKNSNGESSLNVSPSSGTGNNQHTTGAAVAFSAPNGSGIGDDVASEGGGGGHVDSVEGQSAGGTEETDESILIQRARSRSKRNSITSDRFQSWLSSSIPKCSNRRTDRRFTNPENSSNIKALDENALFIELVKDISNELDIDILCHKILVNVGFLTKAERCSLHLARGPLEQRYLVPKLLDVTSDSGERRIDHCLVCIVSISFMGGNFYFVSITISYLTIPTIFKVQPLELISTFTHTIKKVFPPGHVHISFCFLVPEF
jgi:hypothetical protein